MIGQPNKSRGFTLIELMVVIIIAAILLTIAVPSFTSLIKRNNVDSLQSKLSSALATARTEAASRNKIITICASNADQTACEDDWSNGWIIFEDGGDRGVLANDGSDQLIDVYRHTNAYTITAAAGATDVEVLSFNSQGFLIDGNPTLFLICEPEADDIYARGLFVNLSGLIVKTRDTNGNGTHNDPNNSAADLNCP